MPIYKILRWILSVLLLQCEIKSHTFVLVDCKICCNLLCKEIDGREYIAIYFGISKDLNGRIKWHICQNHTAGSVRSGFLSTLRQSLSALLNNDMSKSQHLVNNFIDDNCYLEYENTLTHKDAENIEKTELSQEYYYPLNIAGAKSTPQYVKDNLKKLRKTHKK